MSDGTRWTWKQGRKVIAEWRRSGVSMAAFARVRGLNAQRVRYWRDRVETTSASGGRRRPRNRSRQGGAGKLVPGVVVDTGASTISVHLPRGVVVEAQGMKAIDPDWLRQLIVALEEL